MAFTQLITVKGADDAALHELMAQWDSEQSGVAPGYLGTRVFADERNGRHVIEVDFSSREEAERNNARPETQAWAEKLRGLIADEPEYADLRTVCSTYPTT